MNTEKTLTLEQFAEEVRQECITIMSRCAFGHNKEAGMLAAQLCTRAAGIVHGAQMKQELEDGPDLRSLERYRDQPGIQE